MSSGLNVTRSRSYCKSIMYKLYIICSFGKTCALPECETNRCEFKVKRSIFKVLSDNDHDPDNNNNNNSNCSNTFK